MAIATNTETRRIAQVLMRQGLVSLDVLEAAAQDPTGKKNFLDTLIDGKHITPEEAAKALAEAANLRFLDLDRLTVDPAIVNLLPERVARACTGIPVQRRGGTVQIAMADPLNLDLVNKIRQALGKDVETVVATREAILKTLQRAVPHGRSEEAEAADGDAPAVSYVEALLDDGINKRATDIHFEPGDGTVIVRYRIDGVLYEQERPAFDLFPAIISRIKILASMDIGERRLPQSGRIRRTLENKQFDLRISTLPTIYGENVVIRILAAESGLLTLDALGFPAAERAVFDELIRRPNGIILVTGPTGSGKSTTLYAALNTINSTEINIHTIEDPVEYRLPLIRQSQINAKADLTFARILREILRQDPDVIMVGEIRDIETAHAAIHASLTGHLVFSTLHTNSAAGAISRLDNMEIEPFLVASSLLGVVAQRLCRTLCPACRAPDPEATAWLKKEAPEYEDDDFTAYTLAGCPQCHDTGYTGRRGLFEMLVMDDEVRSLAIQRRSAQEIEQEAVAKGMVTLWRSGLRAVREGQTSLAEVMRVAH